VSPARLPPIAAPAHKPQPGRAGTGTGPCDVADPRTGARGRNRAQLYLWRAGFDAGVEAAARSDAGVFAADLRRDAADRQREINAAFEAGRRAQARADLGTIAAALRREAAAKQLKLLDEVIGVLARAMMDSHHARQRRSSRATPAPSTGAEHSAGAAADPSERAADRVTTADAPPQDAATVNVREQHPRRAQLRRANAVALPPHQLSPAPQPTRGGRRQVA
jgi:hypothetical protein